MVAKSVEMVSLGGVFNDITGTCDDGVGGEVRRDVESAVGVFGI